MTLRAALAAEGAALNALINATVAEVRLVRPADAFPDGLQRAEDLLQVLSLLARATAHLPSLFG